MNLYNDPAAYARKVRITERMAAIWCANQLKREAEIEKAKRCPKCGKATLVYEMGSYEENEPDYIYCENYEIPMIDEDEEEYFGECDFVCEPDKALVAVEPWYDFDILLALNSGMSGVEVYGSLQAWLKFAKEEIQKAGEDGTTHG